MMKRLSPKISLALSLVVALGSAFADPGLALYRFGGGDGRFLVKYSESVLDKPFNNYLDRKGKDSWAKGALAVPADGTYAFKTVANRMMMRLDGVDYFFRGGSNHLEFVTHELKLAKGTHPFEVFVSNRIPFGRDGDMNVYWKKPGDADFEKIPMAAFSHTAADRGLKTPIVSDLEVTCVGSSSCFCKYRFTVRDEGYYRLKFRRCGMFRWSSAYNYTDVFVDGEMRRHFYTAREFGDDFFDNDVIVLRLKAGEHAIELRGQSAEAYLKELPRVTVTRIDATRESAATFTVSEKLQGESVFRRGEDIVWNVTRSTLGATAPVPVTVRVVVQRTRRPAWEKTVELPAGQEAATASFAFPKELAGVFEYAFEAGGVPVEGPWEFCVIDTAKPKATVRIDPTKPLPELKDFGRLVDEIDFGGEELGGAHAIRDNKTSKIVRTEKYAYRETGPMRKNTHYCNTSPRDGSLPVPLVGDWNKLTTPDGKPPFGMRTYFSSSDWFAATLKVKHPRTAHVAVAYLPNDVYRRFPVQLQDCKTGHSNGAYYEIMPASTPGLVKMAIPFWPNGDEIYLLMIPSDNHGHPRRSTAAIQKIELYECPDGFPAMPAAVAGWNPNRRSGWVGEQGDLSPERASTPPIPDDSDWYAPDYHDMGGPRHPVWYDYTAYELAWRRFGEYAAWQGQNFLQWPIWSYDMAHVQTERMPWGYGLFARGIGWRNVDKYRRNSFKIILLLCEKYGVDFWGDVMFGLNAGKELNKGVTLETLLTNNTLVATIASTEGVKDAKELEGCFLTEGQRLGGNLNPAHPVGRSYLRHFYGDIAAFCSTLPAFKGMNIRQWNACSSTMSAWWCSALAGYDDWTLDRFAEATGIRCPANLKKPTERQAWFMGDDKVREKWLDWRAEKVTTLRREILAEMRKHRPDATLRANVQEAFAPVKELGMGLDRTKLTKELGFNVAQGSISVQGNEMCGLDPVVFKGYDIRPQVVHTNEPLWGVRRRSLFLSGLCTGAGMLAPPYSTKGFATAMAEGALDVAYWGSYWAYPADNVEVREFVRTLRAVPDGTYERIMADNPDPSVVCRRSGNVAYFVSLRPHPQTVALDAEAEDLVRGGKAKTLVLAPFGLRLVRTARPLERFALASDAKKPGFFASLFKGDKSPDKSAARTLKLTVRNDDGAAHPRALCVVRGGELIAKGVRTTALKLFRDGREIPVQVDRCDAQGNYVKGEASAPLGAKDEVCFLHDFAAGETSATFQLTEGGRPAQAFAVPFAFANDREVYDSNHRLWTNGILKVTNGDLAAEFCGLAMSRLAWKGKAAFDGTLGKPRSRNLLGGFPPGNVLVYPKKTTEKVNERGFSVLSVGPVRALVGMEFPDPITYRKYMNGEPRDILYPAFLGFRTAVAWQFTAGDATIRSRLHFAWDESYMPGLELLWWHDDSYRRPATPMDPKKLYAGPLSDPVAFAWNKPVKGTYGWGEKFGLNSTWYALFDPASGATYGEAMDPVLAARGGFGISRTRASVMEMRGTPVKKGTADFRRAYRAWDADPGVKEASAWANAAFTPEPVVTVE